MQFLKTLLFLILLGCLCGCQTAGHIADKPLYRDPVFDGAADPTLIWNPQVKRWWMFYTNRRANAPGLSGVAWVHGTPIGIAASADGAHWKYFGDAQIELPDEYGGTNVTRWAPDVIRAPDGSWQMFLTVVPGIFENWNHPRDIVQLTSTDLLHWKNPRKISLASDRVIDPSILHLPDGTWRLFYNDERTGKSIHFADSVDLQSWTDKGLAFKSRGEGPKAFRWRGKFWCVIDEWKGLGVFRSDDALHWDKQATNLVAVPGHGADDQDIGRHCDVVVGGERAFLFYFTHPGIHGTGDEHDHRRSSIQVTELRTENGWLKCDRNLPTQIFLGTPK
jgi:hypothetical protein